MNISHIFINIVRVSYMTGSPHYCDRGNNAGFTDKDLLIFG